MERAEFPTRPGDWPDDAAPVTAVVPDDDLPPLLPKAYGRRPDPVLEQPTPVASGASVLWPAGLVAVLTFVLVFLGVPWNPLLPALVVAGGAGQVTFVACRERGLRAGAVAGALLCLLAVGPSWAVPVTCAAGALLLWLEGKRD